MVSATMFRVPVRELILFHGWVCMCEMTDGLMIGLLTSIFDSYLFIVMSLLMINLVLLTPSRHASFSFVKKINPHFVVPSPYGSARFSFQRKTTPRVGPNP